MTNSQKKSKHAIMIKIAKLYTELDNTDDQMECVMITDEIERLLGQTMNQEEKTDRITDLEAQVVALKKIAKCERAQRLRDLVDYETDDTMMPDFYEDACRMLVMEHPEVDWR